MGKIDPIQTQALSHIHKKYIQNMILKVELLKEIKVGGKEEKNDRK
jgi:hypothetical protein